jgi:Double zinc ribbon
MSTLKENLSRHVESYSLAQPSSGGFWANVKIIRPVAWWIAAIAALGLEAVLWAAPTGMRPHPGVQELNLALKVLFSVAPQSLLFVAILLYGYIYADAKRRGMRQVMWTLLAIFVPNTIGIILYFLLREPLPSPCPRCGFSARRAFAHCPQCGAELNRICRVCRAKLEPGWANCAHCGAPVAAQPARTNA